MSAALALTEFSPPSAANDNDGHFKRVKSAINGSTIFTIYNRAGELVHVDDLTTGTKTDYVRLNGRTVARVENKITPTYVHSDYLGSPVSRSNTAGTLLPRERYTPFGVTLNNPSDLNNQAGFTATAVAFSTYNRFPKPIIWLRQPFPKQIKDSATGLNYMQARYYDPIIGRFLSIDPVTFMDTGEPSMFNRYAYVSNDPINFTDPTGMVKITIGASAKVSYGSGGRVGASISYDTNGHTLSVKGLVGARVGAAGALSITGDISESGDFAKSDIKVGVALDGEASAGFAKATAEISGEASLRDGLSGDAGVGGAIGAEAIVEGGSIAGGTSASEALRCPKNGTPH